jgi:hypothetical protein
MSCVIWNGGEFISTTLHSLDSLTNRVVIVRGYGEATGATNKSTVVVKCMEEIEETWRGDHGHVVNSKTFPTISRPVGICQMKSRTLRPFSAMCRFLAVSLPFCIAGTSAAAPAQSTVMAAFFFCSFQLGNNVPCWEEGRKSACW